MGKSANGEHSIYQRADGTWCAAIVYTDPATGKRGRRVLYRRTRTEVRAKLKDADECVQAGSPVRDSKATVAEWLALWQATTLAASSRKVTTKELYRTLCVHHLEVPAFGAIPLDRLRPFDIEALILSLDAKDLSDATVQRIFNVLGAALSGAVRDGLIAKNPASAVKQPSVTRREARHLSSEEIARLLEAAKGSRYHCLLTLIAATGLRRGEAAALRWKDLDLKNGRLNVRGTLSRVGSQLIVTEPKTAKSRRSLPLSPSVVAMLKAHRRHQAEERLAAGSLWVDSEFVFVTETGTMLEPGNILRAVENRCRCGGARQRRRPHPATLGGHDVAREWGAPESCVRAPRPREHRDHRRHLRHLSDEAARGAMSALSDALGI